MSLLRKLKSKRKRVKNLKISAEAIFQKTLNHYFKKYKIVFSPIPNQFTFSECTQQSFDIPFQNLPKSPTRSTAFLKSAMSSATISAAGFMVWIKADT